MSRVSVNNPTEYCRRVCGVRTFRWARLDGFFVYTRIVVVNHQSNDIAFFRSRIHYNIYSNIIHTHTHTDIRTRIVPP